ncbi:MAG: S8/S53 family peptidase [Candidatus Sericytochromatia bacterium]
MVLNSKKSVLLLMVTVLTVACTNQVQNVDSNFSTKAFVSPQPSSVPDPNFKLPNPPSNLPSNVVEKNKTTNDDKPNFDILPSYDLESIDGAITVIYKNSHKIRVEKGSKKIKSKLNSNLSDLDTIFSKYNLLRTADMSDDSLTEQEMDKKQDDFVKDRGVDIPHMQSIHYYTFPKGTDTKQLCKELMKNPFVRLAYPTPVTVPTAFTKIADSTIANPAKPSDPYFSYPENTDWNWFNKHSVFKSWSVFGSTSLPNIAVIDFGFNPNSPEINFGNAYKVVDGVLTNSTALGNCPSNNCVLEVSADDLSSVFSHGSMVASVAAAKKNNSIHLCGIIPGATITPIKIKTTINPPVQNPTTSNTMAKAIEVARNDSFVDVINISQAVKYYYIPGNTNDFIHVPLSYLTDVNAQISYSVSANKPVVITSGNNEVNPTNYVGALPTTDAIVVGGSEPSSIPNKQKAWTTNASTLLQGANYNTSGQNFVDMTASAYNIQATAYQKVAGIETTTLASGTSFAAPMVAATLGMMKKINPSLTAKQLKEIIIYSSNVYKYEDGYNGASSKFMGKDLTSSYTNDGSVAGIRDLNSYNAVSIAKELNNYQAIARIYNIDDYGVSNNVASSSTFPYPGGTVDTYGTDMSYGYYGMNNYSYINFSTYNPSGGCAYGYQIYKKGNSNYSNFFDRLGGVSGVSGASNCPINWTYTMSTQYIP